MAAKQHLRKSKTQQADNPHHFRQNVSAVALPCLIGIHYAGAHEEVPRGFEPRSLDSESRVLTVTPRDQMLF